MLSIYYILFFICFYFIFLREIELVVWNNFFVDNQGLSFDLGVFNIQRGWDYGLFFYVDWRKYCGFSVLIIFEYLEDYDIYM